MLILKSYRNQTCVAKRVKSTHVTAKTNTMSKPADTAYHVNRRASDLVSFGPSCRFAFLFARISRRTRLSCHGIPSTSMLQMTRPSSSYCFGFCVITNLFSNRKDGKQLCDRVQFPWLQGQLFYKYPYIPSSVCGIYIQMADSRVKVCCLPE